MLLKPNYNLDSIYDIDIEELKNIGIKALFFDLDSTLMKSKSGKFSFRTVQYLKDLSTNFRLAIITNNNNKKYISKAQEQTRVKIYPRAKKPDTRVILKACREQGVYPTQTAFVGDRPLTDILAGQNAGMTTILVDSIAKDEENILVRLVRFIERLTIEK